MPAPTAQTIEQYLHDLAFGFPWLKIKPEFRKQKYMQEEAFIFADGDLRGAYLMWHQDNDAEAALTCLENASAICNQRLTRAYLLKYNTVVSYFEANASGAGTPVHQDAHMRNLLLRVTACLH
jgi:cobalamin-dependent methionine synthase I